MIAIIQRFQTIHRRNALVTFGLFAYLTAVFLSSIWILHNGPTNSIANLSIETATVSELRELGKPFGITYGNPNVGFSHQLDSRTIGTTFFISGIFSAIFLMGLEYKDSLPHSPSEILSLVYVLTMDLLYVVLFMSLLILVPEVNYINLTGDTVPIEMAMNNLSLSFWYLLFIHVVIISSIVAIWTRPIVPPPKYSWQTPDLELVQFNLENWKHYSTWIVTLYGGTLITIAAIYTVEVRSAGTPFFTHASILLGGGLFMILLFLMFKMWECERILKAPNHL